jgi:hypothetical protein
MNNKIDLFPDFWLTQKQINILKLKAKKIYSQDFYISGGSLNVYGKGKIKLGDTFTEMYNYLDILIIKNRINKIEKILYGKKN